MSGYYRNLTYQNSSRFIGARLKLKRAERHLLEVENSARGLTQLAREVIIFPPKPETGQAELWVPTDAVMPMEFAATLGDAIHNIRSALDHAAVVLTTPPLGEGDMRKAHFPTGATLTDFLKAREDKMRGASPDALRMVEQLEHVQWWEALPARPPRTRHSRQAQTDHTIRLAGSRRNAPDLVWGEALYA